ncbi:hypothetical protein HHI36_020497 [Cryptolaemus montrouzieri]|uniref:Glutathione S-transferase 1-like n=1 Tax=Cryptolaemus montrouzieri TaxID=559131 RepID=A0ABD2NAG3_9CUCU
MKMAPKLVLYEFVASPPVRVVKMLAKSLNLELELKPVNLMNKEQYNPEYLKVNPTHTVPTLIDNGLIVWDSHAIMIYLMDKYAKNDSMYPKDLVKRAMINKLLFYDASIFDKMIGMMRPIFFGDVKELTDWQKASLVDSYESIERILDGNNFVAGNDVTIADISLVVTLTSANCIVPIDFKKFTKIAAWIKIMESFPFYEPNVVGLKLHAEIVKKFLNE